MTNMDTFNAKKDELLANISNSISANDAEGMKGALDAWQGFMLGEFEAAKNEFAATADKNVLAARGVRQLTTEETNYFNEFITKARAAAGDGVITNIGKALPETVINAALEDIKQSHPLLAAIDFQNTAAAIKWVLNDKGAQSATWDELNTAISTEVKGQIDVLDMVLCKLTAFMYCTNDMLDLGPAWVEAYVRMTLAEALANGLEAGIVDGDGVKKPIGMTRDFTKSFSSTTGYPRKTATAVTDLSVATFSTVLDTLSKTRLGNTRDVASVILVVNPADYFTKVMPATTILTPNGTYQNNVFPFPTTVIRSTAVPTGHAVVGIAKNYFMGLGSSKGGKLEYSDDFKFLDDLRTYKIKLYGNGRAVDINSFVYLDISGVKPVYPTVNTLDVTPATAAAKG